MNHSNSGQAPVSKLDGSAINYVAVIKKLSQMARRLEEQDNSDAVWLRRAICYLTNLSAEDIRQDVINVYPDARHRQFAQSVLDDYFSRIKKLRECGGDICFICNEVGGLNYCEKCDIPICDNCLPSHLLGHKQGYCSPKKVLVSC